MKKPAAPNHGETDRKRRLDQALDEGLRQTFPGSDPVSVVQPRKKSDKVAKVEPEGIDESD